MKVIDEKRYEVLSPFELKNKLIDMAKTHHERMMLNAGRGNPNWVATIPREAFFHLGYFAIGEAKRLQIRPMFGGSPTKEGVAKRFKQFLETNKQIPAITFLKDTFKYVTQTLKIDADTFVFEMVDGIMGDHYPTPDRMLSCCEKIVHQYLIQEMCGNASSFGTMHLFATEGGTTAMEYVFNSLMENHLLKKGDKIALGTPIFTPYLEIPHLNDFEFEVIEIKQDENNHWQYPEEELKKLLDKDIKAFFLVNPSNPTAVNIHKDALTKLADIVNNQRQDLILLTDDVYGTFVNEFKSLMSIAPKNTILVYSFSKYFGATGWRLGVVGIHEDNVFDKNIANYSQNVKQSLHKRYETVTLDPDSMKLIDRMVADSRLVALNHTAGLSTPQQIQMALFSLYCLLDTKNTYKKSAQDIVKHRFELLYEALGTPQPDNPYDTHYYTTIDIPQLAEIRYGKAFKDYLTTKFERIDFVMRLAEEKSIVLMDGGGFDAPNMSIRVSLANLKEEDYQKIGKGISELLEDYYSQWKGK